jgi:NADH dehydrogenase [ubiquinone] 1 alpha subcomplex assembly factor 2
MVEYADEPAYRNGTAQLPAQWTAWMSFTRDAPPSLGELQRDAARIARLGPLVAAIEAREREERILQGYLLPDGSEPGAAQVPQSLTSGAAQTKAFPYALDAEPQALPDSDFIAPPRDKVDPGAANSADALRKLAEEDTKRRLKESGVAEGSGPVEGVEGVGRAFKPRRRGA